MTVPEIATVVDGTTKSCTGILVALEKVMSRIERGMAVCAIVADIPNRIDTHAWAERKGHTIVSEEREGNLYRLTIIKGTVASPDTNPRPQEG